MKNNTAPAPQNSQSSDTDSQNFIPATFTPASSAQQTDLNEVIKNISQGSSQPNNSDTLTSPTEITPSNSPTYDVGFIGQMVNNFEDKSGGLIPGYYKWAEMK